MIIKKHIIIIVSLTFLSIGLNITSASANTIQHSATDNSQITESPNGNSSTNTSYETPNKNTNSKNASKRTTTNTTNKKVLAKVIHKSTGNSFAKYQTQIRMNSRVNYKIYKSGGYNTAPINQKAIARSIKYRNHIVTVIGQETTKDLKMGTQTWSSIKFGTKPLGWINKNALDNHQRRLIGVPLIGQRPQLPTGCEITAVTMMLNYAGDKSTKTQLANEMPRSSNPNKGFVGSPYSKSGWYIYPKGLMKLVKHHVGTAKNLTGSGLTNLKKAINRNHPVVIWLAPLDGFPNHALTITGYSKKSFYINDPWLKKRITMSATRMHKLWSNDRYRALSY